jgi:hypothetical protein
MENERLKQRIMEFKQEPTWVVGSSAESSSTHMLHYVSGSSVAGSSSSARAQTANARTSALAPASELSEALYVMQDVMPGSTTRSFDAAGLRNVDDDSTSEPVRKKVNNARHLDH